MVVVCRSRSMNKLRGRPTSLFLTNATKHERPCSIGRPAGLVARENGIASSVENFLRGVEGFDAPGPVNGGVFFRLKERGCQFYTQEIPIQPPRGPGSFRAMRSGNCGNLGNFGNVVSVSYRPHYPRDETNPPSPLSSESVTFPLSRNAVQVVS